MIDSYGYTTVADFARVMGADGFRLFIKTDGSAEGGTPDDPATKEDRKQKRGQKNTK